MEAFAYGLASALTTFFSFQTGRVLVDWWNQVEMKDNPDYYQEGEQRSWRDFL